MESCVYIGTVRHRRRAPRRHDFRYDLFMLYVDLNELDTVFAGNRLWSADRWAPAWFRRRDYLADLAAPSLDTAVRDAVRTATGSTPDGPIRMLTHVRYMGVLFNPVTFYYCFDAVGREVRTVVSEITNTPYLERFRYVLSPELNSGSASHLRFRFSKSFFVSPFIDMDCDYDWRFVTPGRQLVVHMDNVDARGRFFDATLVLRRQEIGRGSLDRLLLRQPIMTTKVIGAIYLQSLKLLWKRAPIFDHPEPAGGDIAPSPARALGGERSRR